MADNQQIIEWHLKTYNESTSAVDELKGQVASLTEQFKKLGIESQNAADAAQRSAALAKQGETYKQLANASNALSDAQDKAADAMKEAGLAAGLSEEHMLTLREVMHGLVEKGEEVGGTFANWLPILETVNYGVAAVVSVYSLMGVAAVEASRKLGAMGQELQHASEDTGLSVQAIQALSTAANRAGTSFEALRPRLEIFLRRVGDAQSGSTAAAAAFTQWGISLREGNGDLSSTDTMLKRLADSLRDQPTAAARNAEAWSLFGRGSSTVTHTILQNMEEIDKHNQEIGISLNNVQQGMAAEANEATSRMREAWQGMSTQLTIAWASAGTQIQNSLAGIIEIFDRLLVKLNDSVESSGKLSIAFAGNKLDPRAKTILPGAGFVNDSDVGWRKYAAEGFNAFLGSNPITSIAVGYISGDEIKRTAEKQAQLEIDKAAEASAGRRLNLLVSELDKIKEGISLGKISASEALAAAESTRKQVQTGQELKTVDQAISDIANTATSNLSHQFEIIHRNAELHKGIGATELEQLITLRDQLSVASDIEAVNKRIIDYTKNAGAGPLPSYYKELATQTRTLPQRPPRLGPETIPESWMSPVPPPKTGEKQKVDLPQASVSIREWDDFRNTIAEYTHGLEEADALIADYTDKQGRVNMYAAAYNAVLQDQETIWQKGVEHAKAYNATRKDLDRQLVQGVENFAKIAITGIGSIKDAWNSFIADMIITLIKLALLKSGSPFLAGIGALLQSGGTILTAQSGFVTSGVRGVDTQLVAVGQGETIVSHRDTNRMGRFLDDWESSKLGGRTQAQASYSPNVSLAINVTEAQLQGRALDDWLRDKVMPKLGPIMASGSYRR